MQAQPALRLLKLCALAFFVSTALVWVTPIGPAGAAFVNEEARGSASSLTENPAPLGGYQLAFNIRDFKSGSADIYVLDAGGLHRLTDGPIVEEDQSGLSPPGGVKSRRSLNARPVFSRDGSKIAFESNRDDKDNWEIYVMNADGSGVSRISNQPGFDGRPAWSPDGSKIAFTSYRDGNWEIYVMNVDGSGQTNLTRHPAGDNWPTWSPDGTKIAFMSNRDESTFIYVMNADGSDVTQLTNAEPPISTPWFDGTPAWSPDGTKIAFVRAHDDLGWLNGEIYVMNADGSGQTRLTENTIDEGEPAWSADASKIAFVASRPPPDSPLYDIHVMNADGSGRTQVTERPLDNEQSPTWGRRTSDGSPTSDSDGDGCTDEQELGSTPGSGGMRDPFNFWDFGDMPTGMAAARDRAIAVGDVLATVLRFGTTGDPTIDPLSSPPPAPNYHPAFDRGDPIGPNPWNLDAADGAIAIGDVLAVVFQFGHSCVQAP